MSWYFLAAFDVDLCLRGQELEQLESLLGSEKVEFLLELVGHFRWLLETIRIQS